LKHTFVNNLKNTLENTMRLIIAVFTLGLASISGSALAQDENQRRNPLAEMDTDGDGAVSFAEYQQADSRRFSRADADADGMLSLEELLSARPDGGPRNRDIDEQRLAAMQARMAERISAQFLEMDSDGDGLVSELEMQEHGFLRLDRDNNGLISGAELRPRRRGGPEFAGRQGRRGDGRRGESDDN
jgi:Ca2+-binding EF-hand superfamily protein